MARWLIVVGLSGSLLGCFMSTEPVELADETSDGSLLEPRSNRPRAAGVIVGPPPMLAFERSDARVRVHLVDHSGVSLRGSYPVEPGIRDWPVVFPGSHRVWVYRFPLPDEDVVPGRDRRPVSSFIFDVETGTHVPVDAPLSRCLWIDVDSLVDRLLLHCTVDDDLDGDMMTLQSNGVVTVVRTGAVEHPVVSSDRRTVVTHLETSGEWTQPRLHRWPFDGGGEPLTHVAPHERISAVLNGHGGVIAISTDPPYDSTWIDADGVRYPISVRGTVHFSRDGQWFFDGSETVRPWADRNRVPENEDCDRLVRWMGDSTRVHGVQYIGCERGFGDFIVDGSSGRELWRQTREGLWGSPRYDVHGRWAYLFIGHELFDVLTGDSSGVWPVELGQPSLESRMIFLSPAPMW